MEKFNAIRFVLLKEGDYFITKLDINAPAYIVTYNNVKDGFVMATKNMRKRQVRFKYNFFRMCVIVSWPR